MYINVTSRAFDPVPVWAEQSNYNEGRQHMAETRRSENVIFSSCTAEKEYMGMIYIYYNIIFGLDVRKEQYCNNK